MEHLLINTNIFIIEFRDGVLSDPDFINKLNKSYGQMISLTFNASFSDTIQNSAWQMDNVFEYLICL